ncbi:restriction endonuclease subunit S [Pediococcus pentosaceus]
MQDKVQKMSPEIRFKGYTDDWVLRKLGEVTSIYDGTHQTPSYKKQGIIFLSVENIKTLCSDKFISKESFKKEFKVYPTFHDILMTRIGDVGTSNVVTSNDKIAYYVSLALLKPKKVESYFLNASISSNEVQRELWKRTLHIAFPKKINKNEIEKVPIKYPNLFEQQAIGSLFKKLDDLITLQQRKLDTLKLFKKALLQQMFPEKGKDIPKVRFNCSYEKWEKHILGDYLTIPVKERIVVKNTEDLMTVKLNLGGIVPGTNRETLSLGATNYFRRHAGQLIYGKQNFFNGSIAIVPTKLDGKATSGDVPSLNISNINVDYLFSFITRKSYWKQKEVTASGTGSKRIHEKTLQKFNIEVPKTVKEQKYIGNLFGSIDIVIKFDEKIINSFKTLKQALLQNLFI